MSDLENKKNPVVITIARDFGAEGHEIGRMLADELGIPLYDNELLVRASLRAGESLDKMAAYDERLAVENMAFLPDRYDARSYSDKLFQKMSQVILDLGETESCIIEGRLSDYLLRNNPNHIAALLAAIMSTVSSQLLVASSSLTEDIYRTVFKRGATERELVNVGRLAVLAVGAVAVVIASNPDSEVLGLVANAWAGFGAAFGPLIILALTWKRMTGAGAVAGLVVGAVVVIVWIAAGLSSTLYEIVPGFVASWIAIVLVSLNTPDRGEYRAPKNA